MVGGWVGGSHDEVLHGVAWYVGWWAGGVAHTTVGHCVIHGEGARCMSHECRTRTCGVLRHGVVTACVCDGAWGIAVNRVATWRRQAGPHTSVGCARHDRDSTVVCVRAYDVAWREVTVRRGAARRRRWGGGRRYEGVRTTLCAQCTRHGRRSTHRPRTDTRVWYGWWHITHGVYGRT